MKLSGPGFCWELIDYWFNIIPSNRFSCFGLFVLLGPGISVFFFRLEKFQPLSNQTHFLPFSLFSFWDPLNVNVGISYISEFP